MFCCSDNNAVLHKVYNIGVLLVDIFVLWFRSLIAIIEALYATIIPPTEKSVAGEITVITGAGHGIGRELALQYSALGAVVVCLDINDEGNAETVKLIKETGIKRVHAYRCDVTNREEVKTVVAKIVNEVGPITILVNNAGIMPTRSFLDQKPEEIIKTFEVNVFAQFWLLQEILPDMIKRNHGHVVALSSMAGLIGIRNLVPYCASKFAVRGLMEGLVEELREEGKGTNVKFTCIFPYMVNTGLCKKPYVRFDGALGMVSPKAAATAIIGEMRRNNLMATIPSFFMTLNNTIRCLPPKVGQLVKDFTASGVEAVD
ncbi:oxidoreductase activity [Nesidiocoris tenuis]|uniref:Oxidoreductase activity n=1 Tax=Nesidiocoris tenuis TaxID=355587 RepID=A0ABN7AM07_9HEMI|nr:oxidoreductase activity [Nesidiocoris tenuis]